GTRPQQRGGVEGLVVLRVRKGVCLPFPSAGAVHIQLVLLVTRDIGAGANDRRARQSELVARIGVAIGPRAAGKRATDPPGLPVEVPQPGLEGCGRREKARAARL